MYRILAKSVPNRWYQQFGTNRWYQTKTIYVADKPQEPKYLTEVINKHLPQVPLIMDEKFSQYSSILGNSESTITLYPYYNNKISLYSNRMRFKNIIVYNHFQLFIIYNETTRKVMYISNNQQQTINLITQKDSGHFEDDYDLSINAPLDQFSHTLDEMLDILLNKPEKYQEMYEKYFQLCNKGKNLVEYNKGLETIRASENAIGCIVRALLALWLAFELFGQRH